MGDLIVYRLVDGDACVLIEQTSSIYLQVVTVKR